MLAVLLSFMTIEAYASTPSNAVKRSDLEGDELDGSIYDTIENDLLNDLLSSLYLLLSGDTSVLGPAFSGQGLLEATPSDAEFETAVYGLDAVPFAAGGSEYMANVISYDVSVGGVDYVLYLSPDYVDQLYIDSAGRLWNVGTSNISGRLFTGSFDATATTGRLLTLGPCLGNNFSSNRNYGSPNYVRRYYWSGNSLNYDTSYVVVQVKQSRYPFRVSDTLWYVIIFLTGGVLLCLWKRSSR